MATITTPNMSLPVPIAGVESGPQYALDVNNCLSIIDSHNHTPGSGVQITPAGLNINASLPFNNNFATSVAGVTLQAQSVTPANSTVYRNGVDLWFTDGSGNNVRLTSGGSVATSPGNISGLVPPASAAYISFTGTFQFQSNSSTPTAANLDGASINLRNTSPNSTNAVTLSPPSTAALTSNYNVYLPFLPGASKIMTIDNAGQIRAVTDVDNSTLTISSNIIQVANGGITNNQVSGSAAIAYSKLNLVASIQGTDIAIGANIPGSALAATSVAPSRLTNANQAFGSIGGGGTFSTSSGTFQTALAVTLTGVVGLRPVNILLTTTNAAGQSLYISTIFNSTGALYKIACSGLTMQTPDIVGGVGGTGNPVAGPMGFTVLPFNSGSLTVTVFIRSIGGDTITADNIRLDVIQ